VYCHRVTTQLQLINISISISVLHEHAMGQFIPVLHNSSIDLSLISSFLKTLDHRHPTLFGEGNTSYCGLIHRFRMEI
jgi:hypothetical protein